MKKIIIGLLAVLLTPLANATIFRYVDFNIPLGNGGTVDALFTEYDSSTSVMTWAVDNAVRNGALMDGFWLVTNNGPAPPTAADGLAIFYADFNSNSLWAFEYNGANDDTSYATSQYLGDFSSGLFSAGNTLGFSLNVDPIYANLFASSPFDAQIGIWFRPTWGTTTQTDGNGRLTDWDFTDESWLDTPDGGYPTIVPIPGALLLYGSALFGLGLVRRGRSK